MNEERFIAKRFLEFVEDCRKAGICLPTQSMERHDFNYVQRFGNLYRQKRYWCGHGGEESKVYWFSYPDDVGAITYLGGAKVPSVTIPTCDNCEACAALGYVRPAKRGLIYPYEII